MVRRRLLPIHAVENRRQRQKPATLAGLPGLSGEPSKVKGRVVRPKLYLRDSAILLAYGMRAGPLCKGQEMPKATLTEAAIRAFPVPASGGQDYYDQKCSGLVLRIRSARRKRPRC